MFRSILNSIYNTFAIIILLCLILILFMNSNAYSKNEIYLNLSPRSEMLIDNNGFDGIWSPDGKRILYTILNSPQGNKADQNKYPQLWVYDINNNKKNKLIENAFFGRWSKDGKLIVYLKTPIPKAGSFYPYGTYEGVSIYNLEKKKSYGIKIFSSQAIDVFSNTKVIKAQPIFIDDNKILFLDYIIDLDTLQEKYVDQNDNYMYRLQDGYNNSNKDFKIFSGNISEHIYLKSPSKEFKYIYNLSKIYPGEFPGVWLTNNNFTYIRKILPDDCGLPQISPNKNMLIFQRKKKGLFITKLIDVPLNIYSFSIKNILKEDGYEIGDVFAISPPKYNPLNDKLVGHEKLIKGVFAITEFEADSAIISPLIVGVEINNNDVAVLSWTEKLFTLNKGIGLNYKESTINNIHLESEYYEAIKVITKNRNNTDMQKYFCDVIKKKYHSHISEVKIAAVGLAKLGKPDSYKCLLSKLNEGFKEMDPDVDVKVIETLGKFINDEIAYSLRKYVKKKRMAYDMTEAKDSINLANEILINYDQK